MTFDHKVVHRLVQNLPVIQGVKRHTIAMPKHQALWFRNKEELLSKILKMKSDSIKQLDIVTDYDYTLTKFKNQGMSCHSLFGMWGTSQHLPNDFKQTLINTYMKYGPFETDLSIPFTERLMLMDEFYKLQKGLFAAYRFHMNEIAKVINQSNIVFRYGSKYLFNQSARLGIPLYIISGGISDILYNTVHSIARDKKLSNISIFANRFMFSESGHVVDFMPVTVHSYNKFRIMPDLVPARRKNCIVMGDLVSDFYMTQKANYESQISIFFAKPGEKDQRKAAQKKFDVIVEEDQSLRFPILLINYLAGLTTDGEYIKRSCSELLPLFEESASQISEKSL